MRELKLSERPKRRLAAVLAADAVGFSRLMERDEAGALARLRTCRRELIDPTVRAHGGRIVKGTGDGVLAEFASVVDAVQAAIHIQAGAAAAADAIVFRIGVNVGDLVIENGDIFGDGVNVAARLEAMAEPGGVCISAAALDQIRGKILHDFKPLGSHQLKNIARPVEVFGLTREMIVALGATSGRATADPALARRGRRVAFGAALALALAVAGLLAAVSLRPPATGTVPGPIAAAPGESVPPAAAPDLSVGRAPAPGAQVPGSPDPAQAVSGGPTASRAPVEGGPSSRPPLSIVVLPFNNLSGDAAQDYFVDGLTEDLTTDLSRIDGSLVIARNTAFTYKGKPVDVKSVGRELGVRYVLEGSVRRTGDTVRINVQLIDSETGLHLWAERFDDDVRHVLELGDRVASRIARSLDLQLVEAESRRGAARANPDATDLAMRGWALINRPRSRENTMGAADLFQQALAIDPDNVRAGLGLARASYFMKTQRLVDQPTLLLERAETLARRAVALAPSSGLAHNVLSDVLTGKKQLDDALVAMRKAVEINRNDAGAWGSIGYLTAMTGRFEEAEEPLRRAMEISPRDPSMWVWRMWTGLRHFELGDNESALRWLRMAAESNPNAYLLFFYYGGVAGSVGREDEARNAVATVLRLRPETTLTRLSRETPSDNPRYLAFRGRIIDGLAKGGLPE